MKAEEHQIPASQLALGVYHLSVNYDKTPVLWDISLQVPTGNLISILGPNGAGKSTFIKTVLGLVPQLSGKITCFGKPLKQVQERVAYVPQRESVDWDFPITVFDLVLMGRYGRLGLWRWPRQADRAAVEHYLTIVGMQGYAKRQISQLSGGQQQRVFLARALLQEADLYFMDEPFAGVDMATETVIMDVLKKLKSEGKTVFVVHHDVGTVENTFDWVILLNTRLVDCGPVAKVFTQKNLEITYGKNPAFFSEALRLSKYKTSGMQ